MEHDAGNVVARKKAESSKKIQPQGEYESFVVDVDYPERQVRVGKALPASIKHIVQKMLTEFGNIFSWTTTDLGSISQDTAVHKLGIPEGMSIVIQKKKEFLQDKDNRSSKTCE